jgi:hypothetical protein
MYIRVSRATVDERLEQFRPGLSCFKPFETALNCSKLTGAVHRPREVVPPAHRERATLCRGTWARVTIEQFRHLAMQTF